MALCPLACKLYVSCALGLLKAGPDHLHITWVTISVRCSLTEVISVANKNSSYWRGDSSRPNQMSPVGSTKPPLSLDTWKPAKDISDGMCNVLRSVSPRSNSAVLTPHHLPVCTSNYFPLHFQICLRITLRNVGSLIPPWFLKTMAQSPMQH